MAGADKNLEGFDDLFARWGEIDDLIAAANLLSWDQETFLPAGAHEARGQVRATLAGLKHDRITDPALAELAMRLEAEAEPGSVEHGQARQARRDIERASKVPRSLKEEIARTEARAIAAWRQARQDADFAVFAPHLARMLELKQQEAAAIDPRGRPYDVWLDEYEPEMTEAQLVPVFQDLTAQLAPMIRAVAESRTEVDLSPVRRAPKEGIEAPFAEPGQRAFVVELSKAFGFDYQTGRLDPAPHPFCSGIHGDDTRLTWRWEEHDLRPGLFGVLHETGHGMYEQGLPSAWHRTPLGQTTSTLIHESQSRLWENLVGRSRAFWRWALPRMHQHLPATKDVTLDALWPALHVVEPSLIRVEADEGTYNLHIAVRFDLERALFAGDLKVEDLPGAWDDAYEKLLGLRPPDTAQGVLQDIHWSLGAFGYFPTYTLGTLASCQLFNAAVRDLGDLDADFEQGEFGRLLAWLRENVHAHGCRYSAQELLRRCTGRELGAEDFLAYLRGVVGEVYGVKDS